MNMKKLFIKIQKAYVLIACHITGALAVYFVEKTTHFWKRDIELNK